MKKLNIQPCRHLLLFCLCRYSTISASVWRRRCLWLELKEGERRVHRRVFTLWKIKIVLYPVFTRIITRAVNRVFCSKMGCVCCETNSKMVGCAVTLDTSFAQFKNREYRTVNKVTLLNSTYIIPLRTNVNKQLTVK